MQKRRAGSVRSRRMLAIALTVAAAVTAASFVAAASGKSTAKTISVAVVANPQMQDIAKLTPSLFTSKSGIKVKYTILDEASCVRSSPVTSAPAARPSTP